MIPVNMLRIAGFRLPIADWYLVDSRFPIVASGSAAFRAERLCLSVSLENIQRLCLGEREANFESRTSCQFAQNENFRIAMTKRATRSPTTAGTSEHIHIQNGSV
jgi:hypothetical protein